MVCLLWYANHPVPLCSLLKITPHQQQLSQNFRRTDRLRKTKADRRGRERERDGIFKQSFVQIQTFKIVYNNHILQKDTSKTQYNRIQLN